MPRYFAWTSLQPICVNLLPYVVLSDSNNKKNLYDDLLPTTVVELDDSYQQTQNKTKRGSAELLFIHDWMLEGYLEVHEQAIEGLIISSRR